MTTTPAGPTLPEITHHRAEVNGTSLHYAAAGTSGSPILLVHGFPGYDYYNFEETPAPASAVLPPASHRRLQQIKAAYDPGQAIISAHPVQPSRLT